jgi:hypothetical protein
MQSPKWNRITAGLACGLLRVGAAIACPVLQDGENLISGNSDFQVAEAGTITISFDSVSGGSISDAEFSLFAAPNYVGAGNFVGSLVGSGDLSVPVLPATKYIVDLSSLGTNGTASGTLDVNFQPGGMPTVVPVPASWILLLSGAGLVTRRRLGMAA